MAHDEQSTALLFDIKKILVESLLLGVKFISSPTSPVIMNTVISLPYSQNS